MKLKRHLLTAALTLFCLSAANAQLLRTTVEQGEIDRRQYYAEDECKG